MVFLPKLRSAAEQRWRARSFLDRASPYDAHNRVFYIFSLGRYYNQHLYRFGETNDIDIVEFGLKATIPIYEKIVCIPVETNVNSIDHFASFIKPFQVRTPLSELQSWDVFATDAISDVIEKTKCMYGDESFVDQDR